MAKGGITKGKSHKEGGIPIQTIIMELKLNVMILQAKNINIKKEVKFLRKYLNYYPNQRSH